MGWIYLASFLTALAAAYAATPLTIWLAHKKGALDHPDPRKVHTRPIPRWGGLAIYLGVLAGVAGAWAIFPRFRLLLDFRQSIYYGGRLIDIVSLNAQLAGIVVGLTLVVALGMRDDRWSVPPVVKLLVQIIAALVVINYGIRITGLRFPWLGYLQFPILISQILTVLWIIGFMNAINLADGLDGLAVGLAAIASATFMLVAVIQGDTGTVLIAKQLKLAAVLSAALAGACLGFLPHNFSPARVFMGDGGALGVGFLLGAVTVIGTLKTTAVLSLMIPVIVVALPVLDVALAMARRWRKKSRIMEPDKEHLHHRLINRGWTPREVVLLVYVLTLLLSIAALFLAIAKGP